MEWFPGFSLLVAAVIGYGMYRVLRSAFKKRVQTASTMVCTRCGEQTDTLRRETRGSIWIEIILWLMFILPGVFYSIWRMTTRRDVCPACASDQLVPADSPVGQRLIREDQRA
jgi:hypothetical protein